MMKCIILDTLDFSSSFFFALRAGCAVIPAFSKHTKLLAVLVAFVKAAETIIRRPACPQA